MLADIMTCALRPTSAEVRRLLVLPVAGLALMACLALLHTAVTTSHRKASANRSTEQKYSEEDAALLGIRPALFSSSATLENGPIPPSVNRRDAESIAKVWDFSLITQQLPGF